MKMTRAQLEGNLDQLEADLTAGIGENAVAALNDFRARGEDLVASLEPGDDRDHARARIDRVLRAHGLGGG
jgi:hypothetical protein